MSLYPGFGLRIPTQIKRKVFVSYHHAGDQAYYDMFSRLFGDSYEAVFDNSLERKVNSDNAEYVLRQIRENYLTGSSCTVVLVGQQTWGRKFVDWEIEATLAKQHGLLGLQLPTIPVVNNCLTMPLPDRLNDNINSGYAVWMRWDYLISNPRVLPTWVEQANARDKSLIRNGRARRLRNA
jgi:hypothetical protein